MADLAGVVEDGRLDIRGEQVQIVKFQGGKERSQGWAKSLMALDVMGAVIAATRQLKLKEIQEANSITETAVLKAQEANIIRELYRAICEIPEKLIEIELGKKREIENEWQSLEENKEVNSAAKSTN